MLSGSAGVADFCHLVITNLSFKLCSRTGCVNFFVLCSNAACIQYISLSTPTLSQLNLDIISDFEYSTFFLYPVTKQSSTHDIHNINPLQYQIKKTWICLDFLIIYIIECLQSLHPECKCSFFQSIICLSGTITNNRHLDRTY